MGGKMYDAVIVGAGISGLSLAYYLRQAGLETKVVEQSLHAGGVIRSEKRDGFLIEHGPNSTLGKEAFLEIVSGLRLQEELLAPAAAAKKRYLALQERNGRQVIAAAPESFSAAVKTPFLTTRGKLRVLLEPLIRKTDAADESVYSFMVRRVGKELTEAVVAPVLGGIWAADIEALSTRSALPLIWSFEQGHGSIVRGGVQWLKARKGTKTPRAKLATFRDGLEVLPRALAQHLGDGLLRGREVLRIEPGESKIDVYCRGGDDGGEFRLTARRVVLAAPASRSASLIKPFAPPLADALSSIPYAPIGLLHLAFPVEQVKHSLDGFGFLVPPRLNCALLGAIFSSSLFPERAPSGYHVLTCFCGGASRPELANVEDDEICARVAAETARFIGAQTPAEVLDRTYWKAAIPNYPLGHFQLQLAAAEFTKTCPQIVFLGPWDRSIGVSDRCTEARKLAQEMVRSQASEPLIQAEGRQEELQ